MSFPPGTEMFQFPGFASRTYEFSAGSPCGGVSPFGHPRINDRSHLPAAFRSVPRPSSPLGAKASTKCPYMLDTRISSQKAHARACALRIPHATPSPFGADRRYLEFSSRHDDRSRFPGQAQKPLRVHTNDRRTLFTISYNAGTSRHRLQDLVKPGPDPEQHDLQKNSPRLPSQFSPGGPAPARRADTWWRRTGLNRRPPACKAGALPLSYAPGHPGLARTQGRCTQGRCTPRRWWAREDLNFRPHAYQARALTN